MAVIPACHLHDLGKQITMRLRPHLTIPSLLLALPLTGVASSYTFTTTSLTSLAHGTAYTWGLYGTSTNHPYGGNFSALVNDLHNGMVLTGATLTITHLDDWTVEPKDVLYVNILNGLSTGIHSYDYNLNPSTYDTSYGSDFFANTSTHLRFGAAQANSLLVYPQGPGWYNTVGNPGTWSDPDTVGVSTNFNLVVNFTSANLGLLGNFFTSDYGAYSSTNTLGLGFSPDCHYYDTCVTLTIDTGNRAPDRGATALLLAFGLFAVVATGRALRRGSPGCLNR